MAYTSGTATDLQDLFEKFRSFILDGVSGAGWNTVLSGAGYANYEGMRSCSNWTVLILNSSYASFGDGGSVIFEMLNLTQVDAISVIVSDVNDGLGGSPDTPNTFALDSSTDGIVWVEEKEWSGETGWSVYEERTFNLDSAKTAKHWRFRVVSYNGNNAKICNVRFRNGGSVLDFNTRRQISAEFVAVSPFVADNISNHIRVGLYYGEDDPHFTIQLEGASSVAAHVTPVGVTHHDLTYQSPDTNSYFWDASMPYRFYGSDRFVYAFVKVGSTYRQMGFGYPLAFATPQQYPFAMFVGAENQSPAGVWDADTGGDIRGFSNPGDGSLWVFAPDQAWHKVQNYKTSSGADDLSPKEYQVWPGSCENYEDLRNGPGANDTDGNYFMYPATIIQEDENILGEMPNLFLVPGFNLSSEDTITYDGDTYRVFQNLWRVSPQDYCAVKEE